MESLPPLPPAPEPSDSAPKKAVVVRKLTPPGAPLAEAVEVSPAPPKPTRAERRAAQRGWKDEAKIDPSEWNGPADPTDVGDESALAQADAAAEAAPAREERGDARREEEPEQPSAAQLRNLEEAIRRNLPREDRERPAAKRSAPDQKRRESQDDGAKRQRRRGDTGFEVVGMPPVSPELARAGVTQEETDRHVLENIAEMERLNPRWRSTTGLRRGEAARRLARLSPAAAPAPAPAEEAPAAPLPQATAPKAKAKTVWPNPNDPETFLAQKALRKRGLDERDVKAGTQKEIRERAEKRRETAAKHEDALAESQRKIEESRRRTEESRARTKKMDEETARLREDNARVAALQQEIAAMAAPEAPKAKTAPVRMTAGAMGAVPEDVAEAMAAPEDAAAIAEREKESLRRARNAVAHSKRAARRGLRDDAAKSAAAGAAKGNPFAGAVAEQWAMRRLPTRGSYHAPVRKSESIRAAVTSIADGVESPDQEAQRLIAEAGESGSFQKLYAVLRRAAPTIVGSVQDYSAEEIEEIVEAIRRGEPGIGLEHVTRTFGIRETVAELLHQERVATEAKTEEPHWADKYIRGSGPATPAALPSVDLPPIPPESQDEIERAQRSAEAMEKWRDQQAAAAAAPAAGGPASPGGTPPPLPPSGGGTPPPLPPAGAPAPGGAGRPDWRNNWDNLPVPEEDGERWQRAYLEAKAKVGRGLKKAGVGAAVVAAFVPALVGSVFMGVTNILMGEPVKKTENPFAQKKYMFPFGMFASVWGGFWKMSLWATGKEKELTKSWKLWPSFGKGKKKDEARS